MNPHTYAQNDLHENPVFQKMVGIRQGVDDDVVEWDPSSDDFISVDQLKHLDEKQKSEKFQQKENVGDWDFTEDQKKDFRLNGFVSNIYNNENENVPYAKQFVSTEKVSNSPQLYNVSQISGNMEENEVSDLFFSKKNLQALQNGIRYLVYKRSNEKHIIGEQSVTELILIMRSLYVRYGQNLMYNVVDQVRKLNERVLEFAVPKILAELEMYEMYLKDKASLPVPLDRGTNVSSKGEKVLEFKGFFP